MADYNERNSTFEEANNFTNYENNTEDILKTPPEVFPPIFVLTWYKVIIIIVLAALSLLTMLGNIMVMLAVYVEKHLKTTFNFYIVNLAVTDFGVGLTGNYNFSLFYF